MAVAGRWWRAAGGYMAPLFGLWPGKQNNGTSTVGFQASFPRPSWRGTLKEAESERHPRQAVQRGIVIVKVRDLLYSPLMNMTRCSVGLEQEKHTNIHRSTAGVHGKLFIDSNIGRKRQVLVSSPQNWRAAKGVFCGGLIQCSSKKGVTWWFYLLLKVSMYMQKKSLSRIY